MRAKLENSSTIRRRSPTWRMMVSVSRAKVSGSDGTSLAVAALQPLGGELDRGQRVLDLMGDTPGDIGPGRAALVAQLIGDVVEGQHEAVAIAHPLDRQRSLPLGRIDQHIGLAGLAGHELAKLGGNIAKLASFNALLAMREAASRPMRLVSRILPVGIEGDDARR